MLVHTAHDFVLCTSEFCKQVAGEQGQSHLELQKLELAS